MTLTDFLLARLDEESVEVRRLGLYDDAAVGIQVPAPDGSPSHWSPLVPYHAERVWRDCEAKRRIVEDLTRTEAQDFTNDFSDGAAFSLRRAVALLALPYASHPDYREEWKP